jgi:hypothetical protein
MDVDERYPFLSSVALRNGKRSLSQLGRSAEPKENVLLRLSECCHCVLNNWPRWADCDAKNYLATADAFIKMFGIDSETSIKFWEKLTGAGSAFLDTVTEAAWIIHFSQKGISVIPEEPFVPADPKSKNVDFVATIDGNKYWIDVSSVDLRGEDYSASAVTANVDLLLNQLANRVIDKYGSKFKKAVRSGVLGGKWLGILVCLLKSEGSRLLPLFVFGPQFAAGVFDKCDGLNWVCVHILRKAQDSDTLQPNPVIEWSRSV